MRLQAISPKKLKKQGEALLPQRKPPDGGLGDEANGPEGSEGQCRIPETSSAQDNGAIRVRGRR